MHVHLPKPLHGWREFVGEVGIIVLGVLIALGFEQLLEQWRWHREVDTTRQALANELVAAADQGAERIAVEDCLRDRIGELAARLHESNARWTADPITDLAQVNNRPLTGTTGASDGFMLCRWSAGRRTPGTRRSRTECSIIWATTR